MERISPDDLAAYLVDDTVATLAHAAPRSVIDAGLTSQRWLDQTPAKRMICQRLYGDILAAASDRALLDVGGGLTALTPRLAANARYTLLDPLFHESQAGLRAVRDVSTSLTVVPQDWSELVGEDSFDLVVANDLFPNVDQRLALFLDGVLPRAREVRLSLTFYNAPRFYRTKRIDADEQLCVLAFDGQRTASALAPYADRVEGWTPSLFAGDEGSCFPNGRQVVLATLRGQA